MADFAATTYRTLPVGLQNLAFSAWGLRERYLRYGPAFRARLEWLTVSEWWTVQQIREYQDQQVRTTVRHAFETVPYYSEMMRNHRLSPSDIQSCNDLKKLPVLHKEQVRRDPSAFRSRAYRENQLVTTLTSGTTGSPLKVFLTKEARQFQWAVWWRHRARLGLHLGDRFLTFGARLPVPIELEEPPFWRHNRAINQVYLSTYHLTPATMRIVFDWLTAQQFAFFTGYPSAMYVLGRYLLDNNLQLAYPPKWIVAGSDALLPAFEETLRTAFSAPVSDQYGSAEACGNFARCELGKYHLDAEFCTVELLPVPGTTDSRLRRLVFTGLANPAMPLLRYDSGDFGIVSEQPCRCGRASLTLDRIEGRTEDFVRTPTGRMAVGMNQVFEWAPGIWEAQIRQDRLDEIIVLVVPRAKFSQEDLDILREQLRRRLGGAVRVKFKVVEWIPREANGKFRAVVSSLEPGTEEERAHREAVQADLFGIGQNSRSTREHE